MPAQKIEVKEFSDNQAQDMHSFIPSFHPFGFPQTSHKYCTPIFLFMPKLPIPDILSLVFLHAVSPLGLGNTATPTGLLRWVC